MSEFSFGDIVTFKRAPNAHIANLSDVWEEWLGPDACRGHGVVLSQVTDSYASLYAVYWNVIPYTRKLYLCNEPQKFNFPGILLQLVTKHT